MTALQDVPCALLYVQKKLNSVIVRVMKNKRIIGLTGGIGSGKSLIGRICSIMNLPVYNADEAAKALYRTNSDLKQGVISLFGEAAYEGGELQRSFVAKQVFADNDLLQKLNQLVHPLVAQDFQNWLRLQPSQVVIREAAILFESGSYKDCESVITVAAPEELRIHRVKTRDGSAVEAIKARMEKQWTDDRRKEKADFEIVNDDQTLVLPQLESILRSLRAI